MVRWQSQSAAVLGAAMVMLTAVSAQQQRLTPQDHVDLQELVARYSHLADSGADSGHALAALFTPDGELKAEDGKVYAGRAKLVEYGKASGGPAGRVNVRRFSYKVILDPTPAGAAGRTLVTFATIGQPGQVATDLGGGQYFDEFVKTPQGWRIKRRTFVPGARLGDVNLVPAEGAADPTKR